MTRGAATKPKTVMGFTRINSKLQSSGSIFSTTVGLQISVGVGVCSTKSVHMVMVGIGVITISLHSSACTIRYGVGL